MDILILSILRKYSNETLKKRNDLQLGVLYDASSFGFPQKS